MSLPRFYEGLIFKWPDGKAYHLNIDEEYVSSYVITAGSPSRISMLMDLLENSMLYESPRGFTIVKGYYKDILVSGFSSGIGPASMSIALSEYLEILTKRSNIGYIIRVGTAGAMQDYIGKWSLVVADSVVRDESTTKRIIYQEYPAKMDPIIYLSLLEAAYRNGYMMGKDLFLGTIHTKDDLYYYEGFHNSPLMEYNMSRFKVYRDMGVLATEMEASILPILRDYFKNRLGREGRSVALYVGAILLILRGDFNRDELTENEFKLLKVALEALNIIDRFLKGMESLDNILRWISSGF